MIILTFNLGTHIFGITFTVLKLVQCKALEVILSNYLLNIKKEVKM